MAVVEIKGSFQPARQKFRLLREKIRKPELAAGGRIEDRMQERFSSLRNFFRQIASRISHAGISILLRLAFRLVLLGGLSLHSIPMNTPTADMRVVGGAGNAGWKLFDSDSAMDAKTQGNREHP